MVATGGHAYDTGPTKDLSLSAMGHDITYGGTVTQMYTPSTGAALLPLGLLPWRLANMLYWVFCYACLVSSVVLLYREFMPRARPWHVWTATGLVTCSAGARMAFTSYQIAPFVMLCLTMHLISLRRNSAAGAVGWAAFGMCAKATLGLPFIGLLLVQRRYTWLAAALGLFVLVNAAGFARTGGLEAVHAWRANQRNRTSATYATNSADPYLPGSGTRTDLEYLLNGIHPASDNKPLGLALSALLAAITWWASRAHPNGANTRMGLAIYSAVFSLLTLLPVYHHLYDSLILVVPALLLASVSMQRGTAAYRARGLYLGALVVCVGLFSQSMVTLGARLLGTAGMVATKEISAGCILCATLCATVMVLAYKRKAHRAQEQLRQAAWRSRGGDERTPPPTCL